MSSTSTDYLAAAGFARLWKASREAWERNGGLSGSAVVHDLTETEAVEISGLLGKRRPLRAHATARVPLADLDTAVRAFAMPLEVWLRQSGGNLVDRRRERVEAESEKVAMWREISERAVGIRADLQLVVDDLRRTGLSRRLAGESETLLLEQALGVLEAVLALDRSRDIAVLAAQHCGDAKALNAGNPVGTLVLRALALLEGQTPPSDEESRRRLWERYRVICNPLSSTVLTLNVRLEGDGFLARSLSLSSGAGEPRVLTLRELGRATGTVANRHIYICENPTVVSAAAECGISRDVGLICVEGWPSVAAHRLLRLAADSEADLAYHGDFDWHGLRIAESVLGQYSGQPWRMRADDYLLAASTNPKARVLQGDPHSASWDLDLAPAMSAMKRVIEEEGVVLDQLLDDLAEIAA